MLLQHIITWQLKQLKSLIMDCPEGWLDWDTCSVLIQAQVYQRLLFVSSFFFFFTSTAQKPHSGELSHISKFWLTRCVLDEAKL